MEERKDAKTRKGRNTNEKIEGRQKRSKDKEGKKDRMKERREGKNFKLKSWVNPVNSDCNTISVSLNCSTVLQ